MKICNLCFNADRTEIASEEEAGAAFRMPPGGDRIAFRFTPHRVLWQENLVI